jgi:hypothetical protein
MGVFSWFWKGQETTLDPHSPQAVVKQINRYEKLSRSMLRKATRNERNPALRKAYLDDALECEKVIVELKKFLEIDHDSLYDPNEEDSDPEIDPFYTVLRQMRERHKVSDALDSGVMAITTTETKCSTQQDTAMCG